MAIDKIAFAAQVCAELRPESRAQLKSVLIELLKIKAEDSHWLIRVVRAFAVTIKCPDARQVWRSYNHQTGMKPSRLTGYSYADQYLMYFFDSLSMVFSIVFFSGAEAAASLASRLEELRSS